MADLPDAYFAPPYYETLGIEIDEIDDGYAAGRLAVDRTVSAAPGQPIAHGGAVASLADAVGYWAASSAADFTITPTIDLRIDYLAPATDDLRAAGEVLRSGGSVGTVDVTVRTGSDGVGDGREIAAGAGADEDGEGAGEGGEEADGEGTLVATARGAFKTGGGSGGDTGWE